MICTRKFSLSCLGLLLGLSFSQVYGQAPAAPAAAPKPSNVLSEYKPCIFDGTKDELSCPKKGKDKEFHKGYTDGAVPFQSSIVEFDIGDHTYRVSLPTDHLGGSTLAEMKTKYPGDLKNNAEFKKQLAEVLRGYSKINTDAQLVKLNKELTDENAKGDKKDAAKVTKLTGDIKSLTELNRFVETKGDGTKITIKKDPEFTIPENTVLWKGKEKEKSGGVAFASGDEYVEGKYTAEANRKNGAKIAEFLNNTKVCNAEDRQITKVERSSCSAICTMTVVCDPSGLPEPKKDAPGTLPSPTADIKHDEKNPQVMASKDLLAANDAAKEAVGAAWKVLVSFADAADENKRMDALKEYDKKIADAVAANTAFEQAVTAKAGAITDESGKDFLAQVKASKDLLKKATEKTESAMGELFKNIKLPDQKYSSLKREDVTPDLVEKVKAARKSSGKDFGDSMKEAGLVKEKRNAILLKFKITSIKSKHLEDSVRQTMAQAVPPGAPPSGPPTVVPPSVKIIPETALKTPSTGPAKDTKEFRINLVCAAEEETKGGPYKCPSVDKCYHDNKVSTSDQSDKPEEVSSQRGKFEKQATAE